MNEKRIWDALTGAGLTPAGAAGLMGNLKAESNLEPTNLQNTYERKLGYNDASYTAAVDAGTYGNFIHDSAGYGLAQWTYHTRKGNLLAYAKAQRKSIGDLDMQLAYLIKELREDYPQLWKVLTSTTSVRGASDDVLLKFERPADTSERVRSLRAGFGEQFYQQFKDIPEHVSQSEPRTGTLTLDGKTYVVVVTEI